MVREVEIEKLKEAAYNPKINMTPDSPEWKKLETSITDLTFAEPIIWNERTGNVVDGHQRLAVLKSLGYKTVPCSVVDIDETDEKVLNIALNKIKGKWDYDKLADVLKDFDWETAKISGFSEEEIAVILANNSDLIEEDFDFGDWDDGDEAEDERVGGSYVITLIFANSELAGKWADKEGYKGKVKEGKTTTVIRIEELD